MTSNDISGGLANTLRHISLIDMPYSPIFDTKHDTDDIFVIWCDIDLIRNGAGIDLIGIGVHDIDVILM